LFKGRALFVFSDPGGAKPVLAFAKLNAALFEDVHIVSDRVYPFYHDFNLPVEPYMDNELQVIENFHPDFIFTGTSYTSKIEQRFIKLAKGKKIPSHSFIDHWTSMRKRFEDSDGTLTTPDLIHVIDGRAKQIAINEGLEEDTIRIMKNPYHLWLASWTPSLTKADFFQTLEVKTEGKKIALFAPDPLSNVNGLEKFGFDEVSALTELTALVKDDKSVNNNWLFLIKPHPNQDPGKFEEVTKGGSDFILLNADADTNHCIYYSDVVIGFFSSLLIEATLMKKNVLRYLPKEIPNDPLEELQIGMVVNQSNLMEQLKWI
jgi:hypothetical protein